MPKKQVYHKNVWSFMSAWAVQNNIITVIATETLKSLLCSQTSEHSSNSKDVHIRPLEDLTLLVLKDHQYILKTYLKFQKSSLGAST